MLEDGTTASIHYLGSLDNGEIFDSSRDREPLSFVLGSGQVIPGFESAVRDMNVGDKKSIRIESSDAYGERREDMIFEVPKDQAPEGLSAGDAVQLGNGQPAVIMDVTPEIVRVDANHPLAGEALNFELELMSVS